jgi:hypothetical protein
MVKLTCVAPAFAVGAAALLISAPIVSADPPPACNPDDQQCQNQQNPAEGVPRQVIDNVKQGYDLSKKVYDDGNTAGPGWMTLLDGEPYCMHMGAHIRPGVVVTNIDPTGVGHPC